MVEEMVALAMVVSPRGLAAVTEYRRLAMSRVLGSTMPLVLLQRGGGSGGRSRVAPLPASSRRGFSCHAALPRGPSSGSLSQGGPWKGHSEKSYMRAAALEEPPELTKKRLSRDERTALVKSYVSKFMSENNGEFPTLTAVLKDTGGSRAVVKDILADIQSSLDPPADNKSGIAAPVSEAVTQGKNEQSGESAVQEKLKSPAAAAAVSESEEEESEDETEEEASAEEQQQQQKAEAKPAESERVTGMRRMVGETPGEIKTYSNILSRLRSLGTADSSSTSSPSSHQVFNEPLPEPEDKDSAKKTSFAARILPPRHGMFVRFLHPAATEDDLRNAFGDCGEITRVSAVKPMKPTAKFTYGFIDFKTADGLSNALRKNVEIRGHKVEMEAAPTQNTQIPDTVSKAKDQPQSSSGAGLIDNLVSKVVSMAPPDNGNNPQAPPRQLWNGQEAGRFNQFPNKAKGGMGFQRMDLPPRNESMQQQQPMPPKMDLPPPRNEMPPPQMQQQQQIRMGMPPPPRNDNNMPYRQLPPRTENGGYASPIPPLSDPQKLRKDLAVCLENLPPSTNVSQLKDALGIHGEIYATYMKNRDASGSSYYFEYLCEEGKDNALAAHWVHLNGQMLRISRADLPKTTVVRVSNISPSTPDSEFINACKSCGQVERVESRRDRVRDVFYHPAEGRNIAKILDRLNEITLNQSRWQAKPAPRCTLNMLNKPEGQEFICQQIKALLKNQESMLQQLQIEQRDLRELSMYAVEALTSHSRKSPS